MIEIGVGGWRGVRNDLLSCIKSDNMVEVTVKLWRLLRLGSLVRRDDIGDKVNYCNHAKNLDLLRLLTNF